MYLSDKRYTVCGVLYSFISNLIDGSVIFMSRNPTIYLNMSDFVIAAPKYRFSDK
jgi:hypothetical protein